MSVEKPAMSNEEFMAQVRQWMHRVFVAYVGMGLAIAVALYFGVNERNDRIDANTSLIATVDDNLKNTNGAICKFVKDLEHRHDVGVQFLLSHPGDPVLGIPRATFVKTVKDQQSTLDGLSDLNCSN